MGEGMRFSFWPNQSQSYTDVKELAKHVEKTGWDGFWYADHFMPNAAILMCHGRSLDYLGSNRR